MRNLDRVCLLWVLSLSELIAKAIVNVTASGERNPKKVMERALNALGVRRSAA